MDTVVIQTDVQTEILTKGDGSNDEENDCDFVHYGSTRVDDCVFCGNSGVGQSAGKQGSHGGYLGASG